MIKWYKKNIKIVNTILMVIFSIMFILLAYKAYVKLEEKSIKEYSKSMFYMDTYINVRVFSNNNADKVLDEVDKLYSEYNDLCDKYNLIGKNLYYINHNNGEIDVDPRLYDIIEYGYNWYSKSNGLLNINLGSVIDVWNKYRTNENGIPTLDELKSSGSYDISDVILSNGKINGNVNIDLGAVAKGYVTEVIGKYLKDKGYNKFVINAGGNVLVGDYYKSSGIYKIGLQSPFESNDISKTILVNNKAVVTSGGYERYYEYEGVRYHHIINPNTLFPPNNMASVTVISDSSSEADCLSTILFLMSIEDGKKFINDYDVDVIWITNDGKVEFTDGVKFYE